MKCDAVEQKWRRMVKAVKSMPQNVCTSMSSFLALESAIVHIL